jgi:hypothetical protein
MLQGWRRNQPCAPSLRARKVVLPSSAAMPPTAKPAPYERWSATYPTTADPTTTPRSYEADSVPSAMTEKSRPICVRLPPRSMRWNGSSVEGMAVATWMTAVIA